MTEMNIKRFDTSTIKPHRIILIVGKRGTGKSTLIRDLMYRIKDNVHIPMAMTPTEESANMFEECMPESCVHSSFNSDAVDRLIAFQRNRGKRKQKQRHILFVLDDMMYDKKVLKGQCMRDIFMNGRHLKISFINAMQYVMDMGPDLRSQVDYVFALRENIVSNRIKLWKYFFGGFEHFDDFCQVFTACTENNECIVCDNTVKSNDIKDMIFYYKADITIEPYLLGSRTFWGLHHRFFRTDDEMDQLRLQNDVQTGPVGRNAARITHVTKEEVPQERDANATLSEGQTGTR